MSQSDPAPVIDDLFRCFICLGRVSDARLCPSCSKLCCALCITKWLTENRASCPHCRCPLRVENLVSCRFVAEISQVIEKLQAETTDKCEVHDSPLSYYCVTCATLICSDCAMFESLHKGHEFQRLNSIYEKHLQAIKSESEVLKTKLTDLTNVLGQIEGNLEEVQRGKSAQLQEVVSYFDIVQKNLDESLKERVKKLIEEKAQISEESDRLDMLRTELARFLNGPKSKLIAKTPELLVKLKSANEATRTEYRFTEVSADFQSEAEPPYESAMFILSDFSQVRKKTEVVYSDQLHTHGLTWRLKVYPNGNGLSQGSHLSVFLEMVKGGHDSARYQYRVELLSTKDPSHCVLREFSSDFESGECWGYNRFFAIDSLESLGYLDPVDDRLSFRYSVRPPTFAQLCDDQSRYIRLLESEQGKLLGEAETLQGRLQGYEKPGAVLQSHENPLASLDHEESKSIEVGEGWGSDPDEGDEGCVRTAGLSLMKKFMLTPEEASVSDSPESGEESDVDYPCFVWASGGEPSPPHFSGRSLTSHLDSPPRSL